MWQDSTTMQPCVVWEFPSLPIIRYLDCQGVIIEKPCIVGAQPTSNYANMIASRSPREFHDPNCHISLYILKMHTSDNSLDIFYAGFNPFTLSNNHEIRSLESFSSCGCLTWSCFVYLRLLLWYHCACVATYSPRKAASIWSWWYGFNCFKICIVWLLRPEWC